MTGKRPSRKAKAKPQTGLPFEPTYPVEAAIDPGTESTKDEFVRTLSPWDVEGVAAEIEERWGRPDEVALREKVAEWIGPGGGRLLLDVGCGSARIAPMLQGWRYTGIDGSAEMLRLAAPRVGYGEELKLHALTDPLPFEDGEFDTVLCMNVMRHLDSYEALLAEIRRVASKEVYVVDNFQAAAVHQYGQASVAGQTFVDNAWSISLFLADVETLFPGCPVGQKALPYVTGVVIAAS